MKYQLELPTTCYYSKIQHPIPPTPSTMLKTFSSLQILTFVGFVGGTHYSTQGGGVNYQCLPNDPDYNLFANASSPIPFNVAIISGAEYESGDNDGIFPSVAQNKNVPCARCYAPGPTFMIPAKRNCPSGWKKEYEG